MGSALLIAGAVKYRKKLASGLRKIDKALGHSVDYASSKLKSSYESINQNLNAETALKLTE